MQNLGGLFVGVHNFKAFCQAAPTKSSYERKVEAVRVFVSNDLNSPFAPAQVGVVEVVGQGFLHHQVRKMVYAIWNWNAEQIQERLENPDGEFTPVPTAPAYGLVLWDTVLETKN
jgi:tRNA pseudouridine38-40 synthase